MASNKAIIKRRYIIAQLSVESPLHISNGTKLHTDSDVLINSSGEYFVPGTSLAGAFRNYLGTEKGEDSIYGYSKDEDGRMSSIFISDMYFDKEPRLNTRDGVSLSESKSVNNKFDMEILEPGITGQLKLEIVEREGDTYDFDSVSSSILQAIDSGEIRFGANKNRGFGRMKVQRIIDKSFESGCVSEWIAFLDNPGSVEKKSLDQFLGGKKVQEAKYIKVTVPLKQVGGISIRRYSAKPDEADYEHIQCNDKPVIPGTSWNGAIRSDALRILRESGMSYVDAIGKINDWFGSIKTEKGKDTGSSQSKIVISESTIEGGKMLPMTRNKINRFTGGTVESALYSEISCFDGKTKLEYFIKKDFGYEALVGIMNMVVKDIQNGYIAIGGQTAVGRGIFEADGEIVIENIKDNTIDFSNSLYQSVKEGR